MNNSAIILISCADQSGLVAAVSNYIKLNNGNVIDLEQHVDIAEGQFYMRVEWDLDDFKVSKENLYEDFNNKVATSFNMSVSLHYTDDIPRLALFVSKHSHCFYDILSRYQSADWQVEIPLIISNHPDMALAAKNMGIRYYELPINKQNKVEQENKALKILKQNNIDTIVLARYMQVLSSDFINQYENNIINIHHSFLPAFPGARPYHSAYQRGVKIIGATSHYVTADLDGGPIIAQDIEHVSHNDSVEELIRKGSDIEKIVLARAIWKHINHKTLVCNNRTIVFN